MEVTLNTSSEFCYSADTTVYHYEPKPIQGTE
ncbi:hypothetical protein T06_1113 [Trichinella sp. T6]|nr:hypothetical protein T06_1113 [Trichinella sp. T6]